MRAAIFEEHGEPEVVTVQDVEAPEPGPGEVRLAVEASGMNHLDLWVRRGLPIETTMPHIGGSDIVGRIDALGPDLDAGRPGGAGGGPGSEGGPGSAGAPWSEGDRVVINPSLWCGECEWCRKGEESLCEEYRIIGEHTQGGFAEYAVVPARNLYPVPEDYDAAKAAAAPLVFLTAWRGLVTRGRLGEGDTVLITGASGGVATAAIQIAKHLGAKVFAVTSSPWVDRVKELGADEVYDRTADVDYGKEVWHATGKRGVDVVFDSVGEATLKANTRALAKAGRLVVYGATTGAEGTFDIRLVFWRQLEILGTTMSNQEEFRTVMGLVFDGSLEPVVDRVFPLDEAADAHRRLEDGEAFGSIVIRP